MTATAAAAWRVHGGTTGIAFLTAWLVGLAVLIAPILLFDRPHLQDFPNHLSRVEVALAVADEALATNYERLPLRPGNAAFDAVVLVLAPWVGAPEAARIFLLAAMLSMATGTVALRFALGRPLDLAAVAALPFLYSASFSFGLLPYLLGLGLALHAMALWVRAARWGPVARLAFVPVTLVLVATHYYALAVFAVFAAAETAVRLDALRNWRQREAWTAAMRAGLLFVPAVLWLLVTGDLGGHSGRFVVSWDHLKLGWLLTYPLGFGPWFVSLAVLAIWAAILFPLVLRSAVTVDPRAAVAAAAMVLAFLALPQRLGDLYTVDTRILSAAVPVFLAGVGIAAPSDESGRRAAAGLVGLMTAMALMLAWLWLPAAAARRDVLEITAGLAPGSRLFWSVPDRQTAQWVSSAGYGLYHAASHATAPRRLLVSTTFALSGQHPLRFRDPALRRLGNLSAVGAHDLVLQLTRERGLTLAEVVLNFDHVLLYGPFPAESAAMWPTDRMRLLARRGEFHLYAVERAAGRPAAP